MTAESRLKSWNSNIGVAALFLSMSPGLPIWARVAAIAVTIVCLIIDFPGILQKLANIASLLFRFVRDFWRFLLILLVIICFGIAVLYLVTPSSAPRPLARARDAVLEVQRSLNGRDVTIRVICDDAMQPLRYFMRSYEVLAIERPGPDGAPLKTFMRGGNVLAEDGRAPSGPVRRYYRSHCNFASDYFDDSGRLLFYEYDEQCSGRPQVVASQPVPFPPIPVFTYR